MARILLVDDARALAELFANELSRHGNHEVTVIDAVADVAPTLAKAEPFDLALVDLSFPLESATGVDALATVHLSHPSTLLAIITQGDRWVAEPMRLAWELLPIATIVSKGAPLDQQLGAIESALATGSAAPDPALQPLLPRGPSGSRSIDEFRHLVQHLGHAKLWRALLDLPTEATYRDIASSTGLKLNTIKNYRAQLVPALAEHGLGDASLRDMQEFARRSRVFLEPHLIGHGTPHATPTGRGRP
jgi:DNA-binding NarL/FixJ family response regulator